MFLPTPSDSSLLSNISGDALDSSGDESFHACYELQGELGRGAYSTVRLGVHKRSGTRVAVKCIDRSRLREEDMGALRDEARLLSELQHQNIVRLYGFFEEDDTFYMPLELCEGGELFDRIVAKSYYNEKDARDLVRALLLAVAYCHERGVVHRDLKPENLLLVSKTDDTAVKIADFGFAKAAGRGPEALQTQCGTPGYVAPEILRNVAYGAPVDLWSAGVITYILLGGYPPFSDDNQARLFLKIKKGRYQFHDQYWSNVSADAKDLISKMLTVMPQNRITAAQALEHPWLKVADAELAQRSLAAGLEQFKLFNARRKLKSAIATIVMAQRLHRFLSLRDINDSYEFGEQLGSGAYSVVKAAKMRSTGEPVAIKCVSRKTLTTKTEEALKAEIDIMMELSHPNIIKLIDFYQAPDYFYLVVEKVEGGELFDRIVRKQYYNEKEARDLVRALLSAVAYCHERRVVHRDLKPENLLLVSKTDDTAVKIADFGFAEKFSKEATMRAQCGTPGYVAPEILSRKPYTEAVDMWSVGVITYILLGGYPPFHDTNQTRLYAKIRRGLYKFHDEYWADISPEAKDLIARMLVVEAENRITAKEALDHAYLKVAAADLEHNDMQVQLSNLRAFNARRKLRSAIQSVIVANRLHTFLSMGSVKMGEAVAVAAADRDEADVSMKDAVPPEPPTAAELSMAGAQL